MKPAPRRFAASPGVRIACVAAIAVAASGLSLFAFLRSEPGNIDDGFILMVYVRHLIQHGAIVWNVGEGPVDGCTSMLDLLVKSAVVLLTQGDIVWCTFLVTAIIHVLVPLLAMAILLRVRAGTPGFRLVSAAAIALLLGSMKTGAYGASFLLETPLYLFCTLGLFGVVLLTAGTSATRLGLLVGAGWLVALARPEGLVLASMAIASALWMERTQAPPRRLAVGFAIFALGIAVYTAWHYAYFGAWAPNAYYAKTSARRANEILDGARYVKSFLLGPDGWAQLGPVLLAPFAILSSAWSTSRARAHFALASLTALAMLAATVYAGGDSYPDGRLLTVSIALGFLAVALAVLHAQRHLRTAFLVVAGGIAVFQSVRVIAASPSDDGSHVVLTTSAAARRCEEVVANRLLRVVPFGTVAQTDWQRLKFWCDRLRVLDLEGLSHRGIAHERVQEPVKLGKFRAATVLRTRPEVWIAGHRFRAGKSRVGAKPHPLLTDARTQMELLGYDERAKVAEGDVAVELADLYVPASLEACGVVYNFFVRRDVAAKFAEAGFLVEGFQPIALLAPVVSHRLPGDASSILSAPTRNSRGPRSRPRAGRVRRPHRGRDPLRNAGRAGQVNRAARARGLMPCASTSHSSS